MRKKKCEHPIYGFCGESTLSEVTEMLRQGFNDMGIKKNEKMLFNIHCRKIEKEKVK